MISFLKRRVVPLKERVALAWQQFLDHVWVRRTIAFLTGGLAPARCGLVLQILFVGLLVHLGAACIEEAFKSFLAGHWGVLALALAALLGFTLIAIPVGFRAFQGGTSFRLIAHGTESPDIDVLILPVSEPERSDRSKFEGDLLKRLCRLANADPEVLAWLGGEKLRPGGADLDTFTNPTLGVGPPGEPGCRFREFSWTTGFKTVAWFLKSPGSSARAPFLRAIHLVPSDQTFPQAAAYYQPILVSLIRRRITPLGRDCESPSTEHWDKLAISPESLQIFAHEGVSYENFAEVQIKLRGIIDGEMRRQRAQGRACEIAIDVTGGSSAFSAAAAIEASRHHVIYSYIPRWPKAIEDTKTTLRDPKCYDVAAESVAGSA